MASVRRYATSSGDRWEVRYRKPDNTTSRKRGFQTKRDAQRWADHLGVSIAQGAFVATSAGRATIGSLGPAWLERQRGHMKPSGWRSYESAWRIWVEPSWGRVQVSKVKYTDVQAWVAQIAAQRGPVIVQTAYSVLSRILEDAVRDGLLASNPARGVRLPRKPPPRHVFLSHEQVGHLADEAPERYRSLVLLLAYCGLRWGEAAALRPSDIDFLRRRVRLERNAVNGRVGTLKGHKSREVVMPGFVAEALARQCEGKARDDLLWPSQTGGFLGPPSAHDSWLSGAVRRCQLRGEFPRVTVHDLRHTAASLMVSAGANVKAIQRSLGHQSAAMTLDTYAALFEDDLDDVAHALEASASIRGPNTAKGADPVSGIGP
ncbi:tyrosine-type recombinase/integrase [Rhodococcus sp. NPDC060086]|uniref:tyrosine-type recombinase/integrase n=1 Tax=Rhodococcus sp. NPDC060086 TaxID=3347055 RepID=UPI0036620486